MSRFLDADKVLVFQIYDDETEEIIEKEYAIEDFIDTFAVDGCPQTVNAEPIRHGHWKKEEDTLFRLCVYKCSLCGGEVLSEAYFYKYCPYCGAKIDGVEE